MNKKPREETLVVINTRWRPFLKALMTAALSPTGSSPWSSAASHPRPFSCSVNQTAELRVYVKMIDDATVSEAYRETIFKEIINFMINFHLFF
jgi:hypothetical protein